MQNNNNFTKLNKSLNHDLLFTIFEQCELEPKNEGYHIRLRICPLCEKPHNCDKSNLNTCCINAENNLFNCFRCGNKGHVIRILKLLRRQYNLEIINDLFDSEKYSSTENEDTGKRMKMEDYSVNDNRDKYKANSGKINNPPNSSDFDNPKDNSSKRFSDFSDLECYKVNKNHPISSGNNSPIQTNEYDLNYDENNSFSEHEPENVNNKDYKTENKKLTLTSQKNGKKNDTVKINADESKMDILEKSKNPFSTNSNIFNSWDVKNLNSNTSSKIGSGNFNSNADKNKQEIKISPITSISGVNFNEGLKNTVSAFKISINNINLINELYKRIKLLDDEKHLIVKDYLENDRKINEDVLKFYKIGVSFEKFKNTDFDFINLPTVSFPMFYSTDNASYLGVDKNNLRNEVFEYLNCDNFFLSRIKIRAIGKEFKNFMKIEPAGAVIWGLFGLDTVPADAEEIVITEGEYDAMAVYQATGYPSVSLPNGATNLPTQMLGFFEKFKKIYLWMDADQAGKIASENFSKKLGETKTLIVNTRKYDPEGPKDANDALRMGKDLKQYLDEAKPLSGDNIITVADLKSEVIQFLTSYDQYSGYKSISFDFFNQKLKGLRMGEFSILTGETGSGKTTFLTQLSLDFMQQRVPTLWGSFEIKNDKLISLFLMQLAKKNLRQAPVKEIEYYAEMLEKFPLYLLKFHGAQSIDEIMNTMNYAVYNFDIQNIVLDNLQFMVGVPSTGKQYNKFDFQDEIIHKMRKFATEKNIHLSLVIHPKKTDEALKISSIFGTAKASQEADNIYILQAYKGIRIIEIAKNRFDGSTGKTALAFDPASCRYFELEENEFADYTKGIRKIEEIIEDRIKTYGKVEYKASEHSGVNYEKILDVKKNTFPNPNINTNPDQNNIVTNQIKGADQNFNLNINNSNIKDKTNMASINNNNNDYKQKNESDNELLEQLVNEVEEEITNNNYNMQHSYKSQAEDILENKKKTTIKNSNKFQSKDTLFSEKNSTIANSIVNDSETFYNLKGAYPVIDAKEQKKDINEILVDKVSEVNTKKKNKLKSEKLADTFENNENNKNIIKVKEKKSKKISKKLQDIELKNEQLPLRDINKYGEVDLNIEEKAKMNKSSFQQQKLNRNLSDISEFTIDEGMILNKEIDLLQEEKLLEQNDDSENTNNKRKNILIDKKNFISNEKIKSIIPKAVYNENEEQSKNDIKIELTLKSAKTMNKTKIAIPTDQDKAIKPVFAGSNNNYSSIEENTDKKLKKSEMLFDEEIKKIFSKDILSTDKEIETIQNINNSQETILPSVGFVESFHSIDTKEKALEFHLRDKRKAGVNSIARFQPFRFSNK